MSADEDLSPIPSHVGFIVDGNRRWARKHGLPAYEGHLAGFNVVKDIARETVNQGVRYVSFYAFSTENWKRQQDEVSNIMKLVMRLLKTDLPELIKEEIRLVVLGSREGLSEAMIDAIEEAEQKTAHFTRATVSLCFNYGGWREITDAVRTITQEGYPSGEITEELIAGHLYHPEVPPIDVVVRTSGEERFSNFMLWRVAYSEFMFLDKYWPEMTSDDVTAIIDEYQKRSRRFGG